LLFSLAKVTKVSACDSGELLLTLYSGGSGWSGASIALYDEDNTSNALEEETVTGEDDLDVCWSVREHTCYIIKVSESGSDFDAVSEDAYFYVDNCPSSSSSSYGYLDYDKEYMVCTDGSSEPDYCAYGSWSSESDEDFDFPYIVPIFIVIGVAQFAFVAWRKRRLIRERIIQVRRRLGQADGQQGEVEVGATPPQTAQVTELPKQQEQQQFAFTTAKAATETRCTSHNLMDCPLCRTGDKGEAAKAQSSSAQEAVRCASHGLMDCPLCKAEGGGGLVATIGEQNGAAVVKDGANKNSVGVMIRCERHNLLDCPLCK